MSRMHALATLFGAILVTWGLLAGHWPSGDGAAAAERRDAEVGASAESPEQADGAPTTGREPGAGLLGSLQPAAPAGAVPVQIRVTRAEDGEPATEALVELWRTARGQGVAHRPARLLVASAAVSLDEDGRATLEAPRNLEVELIARAVPGGPVTTVPLGALDRALSGEIPIVVELPPAPLVLLVLDADGASVPGVTCAAAATSERVEFPGTALMRTDGNGGATLPGELRRARHLLFDAPGYAALALRNAAFTAAEAPVEVRLQRESVLDVHVDVPDGEQAKGIVVEVDFQLAGHLGRRTAVCNRRGDAVVRGLPPNTPLRVRATSGDLGPTTELRPLELGPGERGRATIAHFPR